MRRWTQEEKRILIKVWRDQSPRFIKESLRGKRWSQIARMARGLKLGPRLQGYISMRAAERLSGFCNTEILRAIERGELESRRLGVGRKQKHLRLDPDEVREWAERRSSQPATESARGAAKRHGVSNATFYRILKLYGVQTHKGRSCNFSPQESDLLMARYWDSLSKGGLVAWRHSKFPQAESLTSVSARYGISRSHISEIFKKLGCESLNVLPKEADRILDQWASRLKKGSRVLAAIRKTQATKSTAPLAGSIASQALSQMEPGNAHSLSCSDSESTIGQAA